MSGFRILSSCLLTLVGLASSAAAEPQFELDPGCHTGSILDLAFTSDDRRLVSAASDGTIRIWSLESGETIQVLRPPQTLRQGAIVAMALSPDDRLLAISTGFIEGASAAGGAEPAATRIQSRVLLASLESGAVVRTLQGPTQPPRRLVFSPDGNYLAATAAGDRTTCIWRPSDGALLVRLQHDEQTECSDLAFAPNSRQFVTAESAFDHDASGAFRQTAAGRIYSLPEGRRLYDLKFPERGVGGQAAWSPDARTIAMPGPKGICLFDWIGRLVRTVKGPENVTTAAFSLEGVLRSNKLFEFSKDSRRLLLYTASWPALLDLASGESTNLLLPRDADFLRSASRPAYAWSHDLRFIATGQGPHIRVVEPQPGGEWKLATELGRPAGGADEIALGPGSHVQWSNLRTPAFDRRLLGLSLTSSERDERARLEELDREQGRRTSFDLHGLEIVEAVGTGEGPRIQSGRLYLNWMNVGGYGGLIEAGTLTKPIEGEAAFPFRTRSLQTVDRVQTTSGPVSGTFAGDGRVLIGQTDGFVSLYRMKTAAGPQTSPFSVPAFPLPGTSEIVSPDLGTDADRTARQWSAHRGSVLGISGVVDGRFATIGSDQMVRIFDLEQATPLLSLYVAGHDWIAWTSEGYYASSPGAERLMGWRVENGDGRMASFLPASRFRQTLYRPELIAAKFRGRTLAAAAELARAEAATQKPLGRPNPKPSETATPTAALVATVAEVLPPQVRWLSPNEGGASSGKLKVAAEAQPQPGQSVASMRLLIDGRPYAGRAGVQTFDPGAGAVRGSWDVELEPGVHELAVLARSAVSEGSSPLRRVVVPQPVAPKPAIAGPAASATNAAAPANPAASATPVAPAGALPDEVVQELPRLYVLSIGVAKYADPDLVLPHTDHDAQALAEAFQQQSRSIFREVIAKVLVNEAATQREMQLAMGWLKREMTQRDVAVLFFSGHGNRDEQGLFYLLPQDALADDLAASCVSESFVKNTLAATPGRILVLLDACHAGTLGGDRRKGSPGLADDLMRDLATDDYGVVMMCSSMGREASLVSSEHRQSYFTLALIEGLSGRGQRNPQGLVYLNHLDAYVTDRVKELTRGRQHPVTSKPATVRAFPLSKPPSTQQP